MAKIYFIFFVASFTLNCLHGQQKRGLIIGIDNYINAAGVPFHSLDGCVNDAKAVKGILMSRFGFKNNEIKIMLDQEASRDSILKAMIGLAKESSKGDIIFIYYAGHGVNLLNSRSDKKGFSQGILAADIFRKESSVVIDHDQKRIFNQIIKNKAILTVVYDCCYSEGNSKAAMIREIDTTGNNRGNIFTEFPPRTVELNDSLEAMINRSIPFDDEDLKDGIKVKRPQDIPDSKYLFLAATTLEEESHERRDLVNLPHGVFTTAFVEVMKTNRADIPAREIFEKIKKRLKDQYTIEQQPQLLSDPARLQMNFLGTKAITFPSITKVKITNINHDQISFDGGWAMGITPGNILKSVDKKTTIKITDITTGGFGAIGTTLSGNIKFINIGDEYNIFDWYTETESLLKIYVPKIKCTLDNYNLFINKMIKAQTDPAFLPYNSRSRTDYFDIHFEDGKWVKQLLAETGSTYLTFTPRGEVEDLFKSSDVTFSKLKKETIPYHYFIHLPIPMEILNLMEKKLAGNQNVEFVNNPNQADLAFYAGMDTDSKSLILTVSIDQIGSRYAKHGHMGEKITVNLPAYKIDRKEIPRIADDLYNLLMKTVSYKGWLNPYKKRSI